LPAIVTVVLALGVRRMIKRNAIVKRLKSVETLGSVTVICSDKTGTLTRNEMTVTDIFANDKLIKVSGSGYNTVGEFTVNGKKISGKKIEDFLRAGASCNNASLKVGDPTEIALVVVAEKAGVKRDENRVDELPFTSERKYMLTKHRDIVYVKGALEKVLGMCKYVLVDGKRRKLTDREKKRIREVNDGMASRALRVLALASGRSEKSLSFLGLAGMIDPPRKEVKHAIALARRAGIRPVIITGDQKLTALAVAKKIGINGEALVGDEIDKLSDDELSKAVKVVSVFCRTSSEHKVRILDALQANGQIVAMTGDGVNDAPALKKSNVGVAMNIKGTDVSKEVADMVLVDDNFASIVSAVEEGRVIYDNIKKSIKFLLSANAGEVLIILVALLMNLPLPLLPIHILWVNLMTDSLPALALGVDTPEPGVMLRKPRDPKESILSGMGVYLVGATLIVVSVTILGFLYGLKVNGIDHARTVALTVLILLELFFAFSCRSSDTVFKVKPWSNKPLVGTVVLSIALHLVVIYTPLNGFFRVAPLTFLELVFSFAAASLIFVIFETGKIAVKFYNKKIKRKLKS